MTPDESGVDFYWLVFRGLIFLAIPEPVLRLLCARMFRLVMFGLTGKSRTEASSPAPAPAEPRPVRHRRHRSRRHGTRTATAMTPEMQAQQRKDRGRFYLFAGMGGRAARRKHRWMMHWAIAIGILASAAFAGILYLFNLHW